MSANKYMPSAPIIPPAPSLPTGSNNKVCFITGCSSGIGRQLSIEAYKRGYILAATDINLSALEALSESEKWDSRRVHLAALDVVQPQNWDSTMKGVIQRFGRIDLLLNVAGVLNAGYVYEPCPIQDVEMHVNVNLKGVIYGSYAAAQYMVAQKGGHIINISSLAGIAPVPGLSVYTATKYGVRGYSLAIASELRPFKVYVTAVCPDAVNTPMLHRQINMPQAVLSFSGKPLEPADIVQLIFDKVIPKRPLEALIPRGRGIITKLTTCFPQLGLWLRKPFEQIGQRKQRVLQAQK